MDSDVTEYDELNASSSSVGSSLIVPRVFPEKIALAKTTSYPLEQIQKSNKQWRDSDTVRQIVTNRYSSPKDIYDWWSDEVEKDKD